MKALVWHGNEDIRCDTVPDPKIEDDRDAIIKVTSCAICGSDLHLYDHFMPGMKSGDVMGHETMGEVVEVGSGAKHKLKVGDRVVIPFTIICGECDQCRRGNFSVCERTNRNKDAGRQGVRPHHGRAVRLHASDRRLSRRAGRISARAVRRRDAHQGAGRHPRREAAVPQRHLPDRLAGARCNATSSRPTRSRSGAAARSGRWRSAAPSCSARSRSSRSTGCPSACRWPRRPARSPINFEEESVVERLNELTGGKGPEKCIDAVGHGSARDRARSTRCTTAPSRR